MAILHGRCRDRAVKEVHLQVQTTWEVIAAAAVIMVVEEVVKDQV